MSERFVDANGALVYVRERPGGDPPVLLVHGLGESGLCFAEAFEAPALADHALAACDLPGFGRSTAEPAGRYGFDAQLRALRAVRDEVFGDRRPVLVGHSMGGDLVTRWADEEPEECAAVVNVEGALVDADLFISGGAVAAGEGFAAWLAGFRHTILAAAATDETFARYHGDLCFARRSAFRRSAEAIVAEHRRRPAGQRFVGLTVPHAYVAGLASASPEGLALLREHGQEVLALEAGHAVQVERPEEVYGLVAEMARTSTS